MKFDLRKSLFVPLLLLLICPGWAQLSVPQVEAVYGGRIRAICGIQTHVDSSRIFVTTESANTAFMSDVYHDPSTGFAHHGKFTVVQSLDAAAGWGANIEQIDAHAGAGMLYWLHNASLFRTHPAWATVDSLNINGVNTFEIEGNYMMYIQGAAFHYGQLDSVGNWTNGVASPISLPPMGAATSIVIHPLTQQVYVFARGANPEIFRLSEPFHSLTASVSVDTISPTSLGASYEWSSFGIGPDGRLFLAGSDFANKAIAYSDDEVSWSQYNTGFGGAPGPNLAFGGDSSQYSVYYAAIYNDSNGNNGSWYSFGNPGGFMTHPNDGKVFADPANPDVVYMTTDQGLGASNNRGNQIFEINQGIEAVQVKDFDMTTDKETAWLASKSGIRKVSRYRSTKIWTMPMFPTGDGSPYYAVAMHPADTNTAYAGNLRVYKTSNGGSHWNRSFSAEDPPYLFPSFGTPSSGAARISCLEVNAVDPNIVMAGYTIDGNGAGGLFVSHDGGNSWDQTLIHTSTIGQDADINDIVFNLEGTDTVAYIGVSYDLSSPGARSVYRLTKNGSSWTVSQDMNAGSTSTGSLIVATINDLLVSSTGDTILACGTDAGINHPIAYYKILSGTALWSPFTTDGFPFFPNKQAKAITLGVDTVYCAVDNEVYFFAKSDSVWQVGYVYGPGSEINFLYFDELLVGTGTGLYGHNGPSNQTTSIWKMPEERMKLMRVYPNPASSQIVIEYPNSGSEAYTLTIMNIAGQVVFRKDNIFGDRFQLNRSDLPSAGLYLIELKGARTFTGKLMVE